MKLVKKSMVVGSGLVFGMAAALVLGLSLFAPASSVSAGPQEHCEGDVKVEGTSAYIAAPNGKGIEYVCIKAGNDLITFECGDDGDDCYKIEWIYDDCFWAAAVEVTKIGSGRHCKDISYVVAKFTECE
jgi:hypothetical protein